MIALVSKGVTGLLYIMVDSVQILFPGKYVTLVLHCVVNKESSSISSSSSYSFLSSSSFVFSSVSSNQL